jgi:hypothetical protein
MHWPLRVRALRGTDEGEAHEKDARWQRRGAVSAHAFGVLKIYSTDLFQIHPGFLITSFCDLFIKS